MSGAGESPPQDTPPPDARSAAEIAREVALLQRELRGLRRHMRVLLAQRALRPQTPEEAAQTEIVQRERQQLLARIEEFRIEALRALGRSRRLRPQRAPDRGGHAVTDAGATAPRPHADGSGDALASE